MNKFLLRFDEERNDIIWGRDYDQSLTEPGPEIPPKEPILLLQGDMELANGPIWDLTQNNVSTLTGFVNSSTPPSSTMTTANMSEVEGEAVAWVENRVFYIYSDDNILVAPSNPGPILVQFEKVTDISGLSYWDMSNVETLYSFFSSCHKLSDLTPISNWNTSNVTSMAVMFAGCQQLTDKSLEAIANWDTSKVTNMYAIFGYRPYNEIACSNIESLYPLANWNTSNVTNLGAAFYHSSLSDLSAIGNWNTDKVTDMRNTFEDTDISDLTPISIWNTSSVTNMQKMFYKCTKITSTTPIANWDTSKVTNMDFTFSGCSGLTTLDISGWDLSSVTDMEYMFLNTNITKIICTEEAEEKIRSFGLSNVGLSDSVVFERPADIKVLYDAENNINNLESPLQIAAMNGSNTVYLSYDNYFELEQQRLGEGGNYAVADNMADGTGDYTIGYKDYDTGTMLYSLIDNICIDIADYSEYNYISIKFPYRWTSVLNEELSKVPNLIINKEKIIYRTSAITQTSNDGDENGKFEIFYPINNAETMTDSYYLSPYTSTQNEITSPEQTRAFFTTLVSIMIDTIQLVKSIGSDTASTQ